MRRMCVLFLFVLASCTPTLPLASDMVQTQRGTSQSAVLNLNILNRDATIQALEANSDVLFSANVGDVDTVSYLETIAEQSFIALSDNPNNPSSGAWTITTSADIPISYVVDVSDGTLNANLSTLNLPRFDIVASNSTVEIDFPTSAFQLAVDSNNSSFDLRIPTAAQVQSAQLISQGGLMSLTVAADVSFIGHIAITSGGLTINIPESTGLQIVVDSSTNSEITLPGIPRLPTDVTTYSTINFGQSSSQIILSATLDSAAIRIVQE